MAKYVECPYCGSNLDHNEKCDCRKIEYREDKNKGKQEEKAS